MLDTMYHTLQCTIYNATGEMILNGTNKNSETTNACLVIPDVKSEKVPIVFQANYQVGTTFKLNL